MSGVSALALLVACAAYGAAFLLIRASMDAATQQQHTVHRTEIPPGPPTEFPISPAASTVTPSRSPPTPTPTPRPVATASPYTPPPPAFAADVKQSQVLAVQRHPELGVAGSPLNRRFLARYQEWKDRHDPRLDRSNWPEVLADECIARQ